MKEVTEQMLRAGQALSVLAFDIEDGMTQKAMATNALRQIENKVAELRPLIAKNFRGQ